MAKKPKALVRVETQTHTDATRKNIPTAEYQSVLGDAQKGPLRVACELEQRKVDLDPQLVWRDKDMQDWSGLVVHAPPLYTQEKIHPKTLIDDLKRYLPPLPSRERGRGRGGQASIDLFADFNSSADKTDFYQHDVHWANRMILGDSPQVMASLAEREGLSDQWTTADPKAEAGLA
jgi:adenine-specific DNA-methyltransferase